MIQSASAQAALQAAQALTNATPPALPVQPAANNVITNGQDIQGGPNTVLRVIIEHMIYPISLDVLHLVSVNAYTYVSITYISHTLLHIRLF